MTTPSDEWEGLILANGRYVITKKLGEGGMGSVYRALDRNIDAEVVIKIPRQAMMEDPEFAGRFTREIRSLVKLSHPHIVKVTDVGAWEGTPFAVMQYLPGGSLEDGRRVGPGGQPFPCDPGKVARWLEAVAEALDYIHAQGYVHRDVKPGNILFDAQGHAFLSDFGVAKVLASSPDVPASQTAMTGAGMVLGTPEYMAPELIMGEPFDGRVDQYALAVTVYELLCGRRPFEDGTKTKVLVLHTSKAPPRLTDWCPALPERLSQVVLKGLAKDPNDRYSSCAALAAAVVPLAQGAVSRDDRVHLKCPECGRAGSVSTAEFAKIRESGARPTCAACKVPLEVFGAGTERVASRAVAGGTTRVAGSGKPGEYAPAIGSGPTAGGTTAFSARRVSAENAAPARGGTTALSASGGQGGKTSEGQPVPAPARPGPQTVIERAALQPGEDAMTAVFKSLTTSEPNQSKPPARKETATALLAHPARNWVAAAASVSALVLLLVFAISWFSPPQEATPAALAQVPKLEPVAPSASQTAPAWPAATPSRSDPAPLPPVATSAPKPIEPAAASGPPAGRGVETLAGENRPTAPPAAAATEPSATTPPKRGAGAEPASRPPDSLLASTAKQALPAAAKVATRGFDPAFLARKPVKGKYSLEKILTAPGSYFRQVVEPAGMYSLARSPADGSNGVRKCVVTERKVESIGRDGVPQMSSSPPRDLELEPKLAEQLDRLGPAKWEQNVAILTVWITGDRACALVKVEILEQTSFRVLKGFGIGQADIEYETLVVTPDDSSLVKVADTEWEQVGRLNLFAKYHKGRFNALRKMLGAAEQNQMTAQMNAMFGNMMRNAAADDLRRQQMEQRLIGR